MEKIENQRPDPSTQVAELVRALALGWKNLAAYPPGHPALVQSLELVHRRLDDLRGPGGDVVLGIENDGLLYGADRIDSASAQKFAQALYARGVAVLRFTTDTSAHDIETFLRLLAASTPAEQKRPVWDELTASGITNITLQPVDYSGLQVTDNLSETETKLPSLWEEVLRAMMEGRELTTEAEDFLALRGEEQSPEDLSRMIVKYVDSAILTKPTFDPDATFGVRMPVRGETPESIQDRLAAAVAGHIAKAKGASREKSLDQAIELLGTLPTTLRKTVVRKIAEALATDDSAGALLRDLAAAVPQDEILEALRYLSSIEKLSDHALNLLQSLSVLDVSTQVEPPSENVIKDLVEIFGDDDIDRFNPPDHASLLEQTSTVHIPTVAAAAMQSTEKLGKRVETVANDALTRQLGRTIVELIASLGSVRAPLNVLTRLEGLFRSHLTAGEFDEALEIVQRLQDIASTTVSDELRNSIQESFARLATPEMIRALVESLYAAPPEKTRSIQRLTEMLGGSARRNLLIALTEEANRSRRRKLFDFITSLGPVIVPEVIGLLSDSRWYVLRNMIVLLRSVNDRTSLPQVRELAMHGDIRVRMEAIKSLFTLDTDVPAAVLENVIRDRDPKVSETAITLIGSYGIKEGVQPLLHMLEGTDVFGTKRSRRVKSIRALGELGEPEALPALERFFGEAFFFWPSKEERYAAWESLGGYPKSARTKLVETGLQSRDPNIREICVRISGAP
ncbi:MAG: HEAT repeat domain-containing protein [Acidobacteriota bacterium]|nr:HEAT repeat domain-containing protein [Acidobacteriota bacterium]